METLIPVIRIAIYALMGGTLAAALGVVLFRNIFYAALSLIVVLLGTAGIYIALHYDFLAVVQILIYVGAVMTLVIFAIMLTHGLGDRPAESAHNPLVIPGLILSTMFALFLCKQLIRTPWPVQEKALTELADTQAFGKLFMTTYIFPFEIISVILIVVLIGAIVIAKKDKPV